MSKHTPAPWEVVRDYGGRADFVGSPETKVKVCHFTILNPMGEQSDVNAQRIVACVNALEGIDDPAAARVVLDSPATLHAVDMLAALKRVQSNPQIFETDPEFCGEFDALIKKASGDEP